MRRPLSLTGRLPLGSAVDWADQFDNFDRNVLDQTIKGNNFNCVIIYGMVGTLLNVGVWLNDPCFAHGQLYVCISRVGSSRHIMFAIRKKEGIKWNSTSNVVFKEVLIKGRCFSIYNYTIQIIIV